MTSDGPRLIRAAYTTETITAYQAYGPQIAEAMYRLGAGWVAEEALAVAVG